MSGERYYVIETEGWSINQGAGFGSRGDPGLLTAVLDRANCHREVRTWRTEDHSVAYAAPGLPILRRREARAYVRAQAVKFAARLNRELAAPIPLGPLSRHRGTGSDQ